MFKNYESNSLLLDLILGSDGSMTRNLEIVFKGKVVTQVL